MAGAGALRRLRAFEARSAEHASLPKNTEHSMSNVRNVAVLVGSLRRQAYSRKLAKALILLAPSSLKLEIVEIGELPLFNQDWEADPPAAAREFKSRIAAADAVLFVTPEYNRSVPGALKNA